eukprot:663479-Pleurochrysis_carterae.AAC.1
MRFIERELRDAARARDVILANPRLLLSAWGVLARLTFIRTRVDRGLRLVSPSTIVMSSKADFAARFPEYRSWMLEQLSAADACMFDEARMSKLTIAQLEAAMSQVMEQRLIGSEQ